MTAPITGTTSTTPTPTSSTSSSPTSVATATAAATAPGGPLGQDQFMQLLVAQLKNQDPLNPMDSDQMASELAQFSSLTQLTDINSTLTTQSTSQSSLLTAMQTGSAVNVIGHTVIATGNTLTAGTDGTASIQADIPVSGGDAVLSITDASGNPVGTEDLGNMSGGRQSIDVSSISSGLTPGNYTFSISVTPEGGKATAATTYITGTVDGVVTGAGGLMLTAGAQLIPFANLVQIDKD